MSETIDITEIADQTDVDQEDVALVIRQLLGWDGDQGGWLFSSHLDEQSQEIVIEAHRDQ